VLDAVQVTHGYGHIVHAGDSKKYPGIQVKQVVPLEHVKQSF